MTKTEPLDRLILLRLALEGGELKNTEFKPKLKRSDRERLVAAGLLAREDRPPAAGGKKSMHLVLTERGWGWLADQLAGPLPPQANGVRPLQRLLVLLKAHLDHHQVSVAEFMTGPRPGHDRTPTDDERRIEQAYYRLSHGRANERIRLAELRAELQEMPRDRLDAALLAMAARGGAALDPLENPVEIRPQDREAALRTPTGHERHILYLGGTPS